MILGNIKLNRPIVEYDILINHVSPRRSTAIEWILLEVIKRYSEHETYGMWSMEKVFREILQVGDSDELIKPCLMNLIDMNGVEMQEIYEETKLEDIQIKACKLTQIGADMQRFGLLPGDEKEEVIKVFYDVVKDNISSGKPGTLKEVREGESMIEYNSDELEFPQNYILNYVLTDAKKSSRKRRYTWAKENTRIKSINRLNQKVGWKIEQRNINLKENQLTIDGIENNQELKNYLLKGEIFNEKMYMPLRKKQITSREYEEKAIDGFLGRDLKNKIQSAAKRNKLNIIHGNLGDWNDYIETQDGAVIVLGEQDYEFKLEKNRIIIRIPDMFFQDGEVYLNKTESICFHKVEVISGSREQLLDLGCMCKNPIFKFERIVGSIVEKYISNNYELTSLFMLIGKRESALNFMRDKLKDFKDLERKVGFIEESVLMWKKITGKSEDVDEELSTVITESAVSEKRILSEEDLKKAVERLIGCGSLVEKKVLMGRCILKVIKKVDYLNNHKQMLDMWNIICCVKYIKHGWLKKNAPVEELYTVEILSSLFEKLADYDYMHGIKEYTEVESIFNSMRNVLRNIGKLLGDFQWDTIILGETVCEKIIDKSINPREIRNSELVWKEALKKLYGMGIDFNEICEESTNINIIKDNMDKISTAVEVFCGKQTSKYQQNYILDTNILLKYPEVVKEKISKKEIFVVPTKVLEELDDKKISKDRKITSKAREAINNLNKNKKVVFENSYPELLPPDLKPQNPDNLIISVALKYIWHGGIIVSEDINLRNIAHAQKVRALDYQEFKQLMGKMNSKRGV